MKTYSDASSDLETAIERMQHAYHPDLSRVRVGALFVFDDETTLPCLKHQGYSAAAVVRISPLRDRALGMADAVIVVDRFTWLTLSAESRDALVDHELEHLDRVIDEETQKPKYDTLGRPKLRMRRHDHQYGWFDGVAARHGEHSMEVLQAKQLIEQTQQLYFDFVPFGPAPANGEGQRQVSGGFTQSTPSSETDAKMRAEHPDTPVMGEAAKPSADPTQAEAGSFEEAARKQVEAFKAQKGGAALDGRSERVKHQDRQRNGNRGAH
jgi:hypothetical protein